MKYIRYRDVIVVYFILRCFVSIGARLIVRWNNTKVVQKKKEEAVQSILRLEERKETDQGKEKKKTRMTTIVKPYCLLVYFSFQRRKSVLFFSNNKIFTLLIVSIGKVRNYKTTHFIYCTLWNRSWKLPMGKITTPLPSTIIYTSLWFPPRFLLNRY